MMICNDDMQVNDMQDDDMQDDDMQVNDMRNDDMWLNRNTPHYCAGYFQFVLINLFKKFNNFWFAI